MAELIDPNDKLAEGYPKINAAIEQAEEAIGKAVQALSNSESTQTQLNQIVIVGDSSVEAAQARVASDGITAYTTLKERLDSENEDVKLKLSVNDSEHGNLEELEMLNKTSFVAAINDRKISEDINMFWNSNSSIRLMGVNANSPLVVRMDGLYFRGNNIGNKGQKKSQINTNLTADFSTALDAGAEQASNWCGVFLVEDDLGNTSIKFASFLRVLSDSSNVINFATHLDKTIAKDYGFAANDLVNCDFVVLSNDVTEAHVGEVRTVSASTSNSLTYTGDSLGLTQGSFIMIAPKGYSKYKYIGAIFNDASSNILNFTKSGKKYDSLGLTFLSGGNASSYTQIDAGGYVPPTARGIKLRMYALSINSPTAGGNFGVNLSVDSSSHMTLIMMGVTQNITAQQSMAMTGEIIPRYPYQLWYQKIGTNTSGVTLQVYGWEE
jgi:hypothetical protein